MDATAGSGPVEDEVVGGVVTDVPGVDNGGRTSTEGDIEGLSAGDLETNKSSDQAVPEQEVAVQPKDGSTIVNKALSPITPTSATSLLSDTSSTSTITPIAQDSATPANIAPTASPLRDRTLRPKKGILKPPPPPIKPGISLKIRDALGSIHPKFYDYTTPLPLQLQQSVVGEWANGVAGGIAGTTANLGLGIPDGLRPSEGGTVHSVANNVLGVGEVVGGAAVAMVGNLGGRLGRFMTARKAAVVAAAPAQGTSSPPVPVNSASPVGEEPLAGAAYSIQPSLPVNPPPPPAPTQPPTSALLSKPLKRATFILPRLSTIYPISASQAPYSSQVLSEKDRIEKDKTEEIGRCSGEGWWNQERLVGLYEAACKGREEVVRVALRDALMAATTQHLTSGPPPPRQLLLTSSTIQTPSSTLLNANPKSYFVVDPPLGKYAAEALADVLRVEWGLKRLALEGGVIDGDESLKPILHALLVSATLPHLSLAGNRKIKPAGWRVAAQYARKSKTLRYLDVSDNILDRRSMEYLVQAITPGLAISSEDVAAVEMRETGSTDGPTTIGQDTASEREHSSLQTLRMDNCSLRAGSLDILGQGVRRSDIKNLSLRKNKIGAMGAVAIAVMIRDFPDTSSHATRQTLGAPTNTVLFNHDSPPEPSSPLLAPKSDDVVDLGSASDKLRNLRGIEGSASAALQEQVKSLQKSERLGSLVTLDVKGNDIRGGVNYIAQVLKRNRTLKVLNLSDNRIDAAGLAVIAEAMKYNTTLETLDLSQNPCGGLNNEGIMAVRSMLTVNTTLRRLFLSSTGLTTEGAIALAEVVPDCRGVIHLDLTNNTAVELAGIMAISVALRSNKNMRCLDMTVPMNDPQMAELSQSILQSCIRNTETAAATKGDKTAPAALWAPIQKSALVRQAKEAEQAKAFAETQKAAITPAGHARQAIYKLRPDAVIKACEEVAQELAEYIEHGSEEDYDPIHEQDEAVLIERGKALMERVAELVQTTTDDQKMERLLALNDVLLPHTAQAEEVLEKRKRTIKQKEDIRRNTSIPRLEMPPSTPTQPRSLPQGQARRHMRVPSLELTSPNFSIANSDDDDSDAEELSATVPTPVTTSQAAFVKGLSPAKYAGGRLTLSGLGMAPDHESSPRLVQEPEECSSPLKEVNRDWIAEEGEIFRKGAKLGVADEDEDEDEADISGQELKQKLLEATVERTPHAPILVDATTVQEQVEET